MSDPAALSSRFRLRFGGAPRVFRAPGRVNLVGEHTDYNDGLVMPAALDLACWVAAAPRADRQVVVHSETAGDTAAIPLDEYPDRTHTWRDYVAGVAAMLRAHGVPLQGADLLVASEVPQGAGLSSSAALEVGVAAALLDLADSTLDPTSVARLCRRAENEVVGAPCGLMDQYVACHGRAGTALRLDCRTVEHRFIPLPPQLRIVACNSMVRHAIAGGEYQRRRDECAAAVAALGARRPHITSLSDVTLSCLEPARRDLDDLLFRRTRHVVTENARVARMAAALENRQLDALAALMEDSHNSLRDDYDVSCPELDALVAIAADMPGVYGTRMTGGGFGGCTVSLVHEEAVAEFTRDVPRLYEARTGLRPQIHVSGAAEGAGRVDA